METRQAVDVVSEEEELDDTEHEKADLLKWFLQFGFTQHTADKMCRSIPDKLVALQTPAYWATRHIDYLAAGYPDDSEEEEMDDTEHGKPSGPEGASEATRET